MATNRQIRWRMRFASIEERIYTVNIYADGWTGSVTELTPSTYPLTIEEKNDQDLLNVIRYKTGYIRIKADTSLAAEDIFPTGKTDRYVEVLHGSTLLFTGFVQQQEFGRNVSYASNYPPEDVEIPIVSALGLIYDIDMPIFSTPQSVTLWSMLVTAVSQINVSYQYAYFPNLISAQSADLLHLQISSLVVSPLNDKNVHDSSLTVDGCFTVETVGFFIEGLCRCFGCMVHEDGTSLVFSKFDHTGRYYRYSFSTNAATLMPAVSDLALAPNEIIGEGIDATFIAPIRKLTCSYGGNTKTDVSMNFQHCRRIRGTDNFHHYYLVVNQPVLTSEINGPYLRYVCSISSDDGRPLYNGGYLLAYGEDTLEEMALFSFGSGSGGHTWANGDVMLTYTFNSFFGNDMKLKLNFKWGGNMTLDNPRMSITTSIKFVLYIRCGNMYLNTSTNAWQSTKVGTDIIALTLLALNGDWPSINIPEVGMDNTSIELQFVNVNWHDTGFDGLKLLAITKIELSGEDTTPDTRYINEGKNQNEYIVKGNGIDDTDIDIPFACYGQRNSNMLFPSVSFTPPQYPYMFNRRRKFVFTIRDDYTLLVNPDTYMRRFSFMGSLWRMIAINHYPWDEETNITMQEIN